MRVAVVAGPDPGHAFPAIALCLRLIEAGDSPVLFTGSRWLVAGTEAGIDTRLLKGLAPRPEDDDMDAGQRIHARAAFISTELLPDLRDVAPDLVVSDILTAGGGIAAERLGIPWVELAPHPLYAPSKGLPPIGSGLAPGTGIRGRIRDALMRSATGRSIARGKAQRGLARESVGLPAEDPGPVARLIATIPALEVPRPDWPAEAHVVGPLLWEPTAETLSVPSGSGPVVMVAPSTAFTGAHGMLDATLEGLSGRGVRVVASMLDEPPADLPSWANAGLGRQDELLTHADVVVCGGGHGMLAKALIHGVPVVAIPGGGDQWELANRAERQGSAVVVRPLSPQAVADAVLRVIGDAAFARAAEAAAAGAADVKDPVEVCHRALG
ncbi:glycosyl transferase [Rhodococcus sp. BP-252]|uniref:glycosyltransferase n=1 Tax=unclassified Rhodococcus (in: high G+C Gram-positive bacteria) TaxID=192944 RepID=UPI001C9A5F4F|nr:MULTISPECIES: nucleotide disphospho-sugar-binding domain-containing protein [unclassified Rhodococcus (in: high G+C Gram-positive bacteria)]MBY6411003.1 glycosyl transferase [Rhodococcus sp. BP-320]MBY6415662.1 glycosyl transferase [Rhodococcus sp. BP-321]MBY6420956.1 glycosyl transferase [Rhodococcus sp. BP-324]MBY6426011.1 glycosyl transferase [Rhodococcus sp. BP-323]MBY6430868.1 glycosyl transferase [Rhodococcus sp. BP-322]